MQSSITVDHQISLGIHKCPGAHNSAVNQATQKLCWAHVHFILIMCTKKLWKYSIHSFLHKHFDTDQLTSHSLLSNPFKFCLCLVKYNTWAWKRVFQVCSRQCCDWQGTIEHHAYNVDCYAHLWVRIYADENTLKKTSNHLNIGTSQN